MKNNGLTKTPHHWRRHRLISAGVCALALAGASTPTSGQVYSWTTLAGSGTAGLQNATGRAAQFNQPSGVAVDGLGNIYVAEFANHALRRITPGGIVTTLASGGFFTPHGVALDNNGVIYVTDSANHLLSKVSSTGTITPFATVGYCLGLGFDAANTGYLVDNVNQLVETVTPAGLVNTFASGSFANPQGLAVDANANVYVADTFHECIRKITPDLRVSTFAGIVGTVGSTDGGDGTFFSPQGVAVDAHGALFVADTGNHTLRLITPAGIVTTIGGLAGHPGTTEDVGISARFNAPGGIAVDTQGNLYVADTGNNRIVKGTLLPPPLIAVLDASGQLINSGDARSFGLVALGDAVSLTFTIQNAGGANLTLSGMTFDGSNPGEFSVSSPPSTSIPGQGGSASFSLQFRPRGAGAKSAVLHIGNNANPTTPFNLALSGDASASLLHWTTLAGSGSPGFVNGTGTAAQFNQPSALAVDGAGNIYVAEFLNHALRKIAPGGIVTTLASGGFFTPHGVALDNNGVIYVTDSANHLLSKVSATGTITPFATVGYCLGLGFDAANTAYLADNVNQLVETVTPSGVINTLASAGFSNPQGLAVDANANVYVADTFHECIRLIAPGGNVSTYAGVTGGVGSTDGAAGTAKFSSPVGVAVDQRGNLLVADTGNHTIRFVAPGGSVSTIGGFAGAAGALDGIGSEARFKSPQGIAVAANGILYVADTANHRIVRGSIGPALNGLSPASAAADGPGFTVQVSGHYFAPGATVLWNGTALPTSFSSSETLNATVPSSDLILAGSGLGTAQVTVQNPDSTVSNPQVFTIVSANIVASQSGNILPGQSSQISASSSQGTVILNVSNPSGSQTLAVTAAAYSGNPQSGTAFDAGSSYLDVRVSGATTGNSLVGYFYYPVTVTGPAEQQLKLLFSSGANWLPVRSSGATAPTKSTIDNLDGTTSGGRFEVIFDQTSTPRIDQLTGTPFALALDNTPPVINCPSDLVTNTDLSGAPVAVNFSVPATDNSGSATVVCSPASGSLFSPGTNLVICTATDPSGNAATCSFSVIVNTPSLPAITRQPKHQTTTPGSRVAFQVAAEGSPPLAYQWRFNDTNLTDNPRLTGSLSNTLTLAPAQPSDAGNYYVIVSNAWGSITSSVANLTITSFRTLNSLSGGADGSSPRSGLSLGNDGRLFGTTYYGGSNGFGTAFSVSTDGAIFPLYSFPGGTNGANPVGGLALGPDGNFYGTTYYGGTMDDGTVFRITPGGLLTPLHSFGTVHSASGALVDGVSPVGTLLLADDGCFYGTTANGGTNSNGSVFRLTTTGVLTSLHAFGDSLDSDGISLDGGYPVAKLFQGADRFLYGTTLYGGTNDSGTVFTMSTNGSFFASLHQFSAGGAAAPFFFTNSDGAGPGGGLVQSGDGRLYGTTSADGVNGYGTIFKIDRPGSFANLYAFGHFDSTGSFQDGARPYAGLVAAPDGILYGTTATGGARNAGTVFCITEDGAFTLIHSFTGGDDGGNPLGDLVFGADGNLYGTTSQGGLNGTNGTIFCVLVQRDPGTLPRILLQPTAQSLPSGTPAVLQVQATGTAPLAYQWRLNGANLADAPGRQGSSSPSLRIAGLTAADAGNYDVVVANSVGSVTSFVATLTVIPSVFWTNVSGGAWSAPANWSPNRIPTVADTVYITASGNYAVNLDTAGVVGRLVLGGASGRQHISSITADLEAVGNLEIGANGVVDWNGANLGAASLACAGALNWGSGTILAPMTVEPGGTLNFPAGARAKLHGSLTNAGRIVMAASSSLTLAEAGTGIQNLAGGSFILDGDYQDIAGAAAVVFQNQGALVKSQGATSGQASGLSLPFQNQGLVDVQLGTLVFGDSFLGSDGTLNLHIQSPPPIRQFSQIEFHGSAILGRLQFFYQSSLKLIPGFEFPFIRFTAGFQAPTVVVPPGNVPPNSEWQYTQAYGSYTARLTEPAPRASPPQTVASGSVVVLRVLLGNESALRPGPPDSPANLYYQWFLNGLALSDNGQITGSQSNILTINGVGGADAGIYQAVISNAFGSVSSDPTYLSAYSINWTNTAGGAWETPANWNPNRVPQPTDDVLIAGDQAITVGVNGPITVSSLTVGGGLGNATLANNAYSLTITNPVIVASNGIVNWSGGTLPANLLVSEGALLNWTGGLITGALDQAGGSTVNVSSGQLQGPWNIASNAVLNFVSGTTYLEGSLTNAGTVNWLGGDINLNDNFDYYPFAGPIINQPGGVWNIQCDQSLLDYSDYGPNAYFANLGTVQKTGNTGVTYVEVPFNNQAQLMAQAGTLRFYDGVVLGGGFSVTNGAAIDFYRGNFSYTTPPPVFNGPGNILMSGGSLTLADDVLPNLQMIGGTVTLGPNFQGGVITNLTLQGSLAGSYTVTGVLNCGGVSGSLAMAGGATLNWSGGIITGSLSQAGGSTANVSGGQLLGSWNIASNAVLNFLNGTTYLEGSLTNAGTVNWLGGDIYLYDYFNYYPFAGPIINQPGGVWNIQCDQSLVDYSDYGPNAYFANLGTVQKTGNTGVTYMEVPFNNQGQATAQAGTLRFYDGGMLGGAFSATNGAAIDFFGGNFNCTNPPPVFNGPGTIRLSGGSLTLADDVLPNLQMLGGTVALGPNFQGGVITNLTLQAVLAGSHTVTGALNCGGGVSGSLAVAAGATLNWTGGIITGSLSQADGSLVNVSSGRLQGPWNIASNAVLNFLSGTTYLEGSLTSAGTVNWLGGDIYLYDNFGYSPLAGPIINQPGGVWNIQCDQYLEDYTDYGPNAYFANLGTVQKTGNTGVTYVEVPFHNQGRIMAQAGTLRFYDGGVLGGGFSATNGAVIDFYGGNFSYPTPPPAFIGPGTFQLSGGSLTLTDDLLPNLQMLGGTVALGPNFQGGVITNLTLQAVLAGSHTVTGVLNCGGVSGSLAVAAGAILNWTGGIITGSLSQAGGSTVNVSSGQLQGPWNIASNAVLNFLSGTTYLEGSLTNAGTVNWLGGDIYLYDNFGYYPFAGPIINQPGGVWNIQCDQYLEDYSDFGPNAYFANLGTVRKTGNTGITYVEVPFHNQGQIMAQAGTLRFYDGGMLGGAFSATNGAAIDFYGGNFNYTTPPPVFHGPGKFQLSGGSLTLADDVLPNLQMTGGTVTLGPNFQGGVITNLTLQAVLAGSHTVAGVLNCGGGVSGSLALTEGATLNWTGGIINGSLSQAGGSTANVSSGQLQGPWNIASNAVLNFLNGTTYLEGSLTNAGTVNWLGGDIYLYDNFGYYPFAGPIINQPGGVWNIQCDQYLEDYSDYGPNAYFANLGIVRKSASTGITYVELPFANHGTLACRQGTMQFNPQFSNLGGTILFGLNGSSYGKMAVAGTARLAGTVAAEWLGDPQLGTFPVLAYSSYHGAFAATALPAPDSWQLNYTPSSFTLSVSEISTLQFTVQPVGGPAGSLLNPVVVQILNPAGRPVASSDVPVTLALATNAGILHGTLTKMTGTNGQATFDDLGIFSAGSKVLQASAPGYVTAASVAFTIAPGTPAGLGLLAGAAARQFDGIAFSPPPIVQVRDQFGNAVSNSTASINASLTLGGGGSLGGVTQVTANGIDGSAIFTNLLYNLGNSPIAESISVVFEASGLIPATNALIQVTHLDCAPPPPGLVAWWRAEGNANDSLGANQGVMNGTATFSSGKVGQGFHFNGDNDSYLLVPYSDQIVPGNGSFTIECWINTSQPTGFIWIQYALGSLGSGGSDDIELYIGTDITPMDTPSFGVRDHSGNLQTLQAATHISDGQYHHLSAGRDLANGLLFLYVDGVAHTLPLSATGSLFADGQTAQLMIGNAYWCCGQPIGDYHSAFSGVIDEISYYNRALTSNEVASLFVAGSVGKCLSGPASNLIVNGSFEEPVVPANSYTAAIPSGWTWTRGLDSSFVLNGTFRYGNAGYGPAEDGRQFLVIGSAGDGLLSQVVTIPAPGDYQLSWYAIVGAEGQASSPSPYSVSFGNQSGQYDAGASLAQSWESQSLSLNNLAAGQYTLTFTPESVQHGFSTLIDNVSLVAVSAAAPAPPVFASPLLNSDGKLTSTVTGQPNSVLDVLTSTDLLTWRLCGTFTNLTGHDPITLPVASQGAGFFRLRQH